MQNPINQHIVPEVLLKNFSFNKEGFLFRANIKSIFPGVHPKKVNVSGICYQPDYFTIETSRLLEKYDLEDKYFIEKEAFDYENNLLQKSINKVIERQPLNIKIARSFLNALLSIKRRNQSFRTGFNSENFKGLANNHIEKLKLWDEHLAILVEKELKNRLESDGDKLLFDIYREGFIMQTLGIPLESDERILNNLSKLEFFIYETTLENPFIINDNPGCTIQKDETVMNTGLFDFHTFMFPLAPEYMLMILSNKKESFSTRYKGIKKVNYRIASKEIVEFCNKAAVVNCIQNIFSNNESVLKNLIEKYHKYYIKQKR